MLNGQFTSYKVMDRSYTSVVKRQITRLLKKNGYRGQKIGELDIIVSEMTSNLVKHTDAGGYLMYRANTADDDSYFEIFCIDGGPGTNDMPRMMKDGNSSANTLGQGLGAISRLSDVFQVYSVAGWGTVMYARKNMLDSKLAKKQRPLQIKVAQEAIAGETVCGDGYFIKELAHATHIFVCDGLGHGPHALEATHRAIEAFRECNDCSATETLRFIHDKVKKTRGLVGSIAILDHKKQKWHLAGIGNIATRIYKGLLYKNYMPYNGIIGLNIPNTMSDNVVEAESYQTIIMTSDGIRNKWDLATYTSLLKYCPAIIAAAIFKDHARRTDDMTVLVGKLTF